MSDLFRNHIVGFLMMRLTFFFTVFQHVTAMPSVPVTTSVISLPANVCVFPTCTSVPVVSVTQVSMVSHTVSLASVTVMHLPARI